MCHAPTKWKPYTVRGIQVEGAVFIHTSFSFLRFFVSCLTPFFIPSGDLSPGECERTRQKCSLGFLLPGVVVKLTYLLSLVGHSLAKCPTSSHLKHVKAALVCILLALKVVDLPACSVNQAWLTTCVASAERCGLQSSWQFLTGGMWSHLSRIAKHRSCSPPPPSFLTERAIFKACSIVWGLVYLTCLPGTPVNPATQKHLFGIFAVNALGQRVIYFTNFLWQSPAPVCKFLGVSFLPCLLSVVS